MGEHKDLIVIGSGPGGYVGAVRAAQLGLDVAVVEKDPKFGGTCLHRGCIPTKALLHTASVLEQARQAEKFGVLVPSADLDLGRAQAYKQSVVDKNASGIEFLFKKNKIEGIHGRGRVLSPTEVEIQGADGSMRRLSARFIMIATGSVPRQVPIAPTDGHRVVDSDQILQVGKVPASLMVIGSGAVGSEFASIFRSFGSEVTLVEMLPRVLPLEDEEVSKELRRSFKKRGIAVKLETKLARTELGPSGLSAVLESNGEVESFRTEMLLVAIGRTPVTDAIGLRRSGVELERGYVGVNQWMQSSVSNIYAIGDVVRTPWLAHVASAEGILAAEHMAGHETYPLNYDHVPSVTYCEPEVGSVGLTEAVARERGYDVAVGKFPFSASGKAAIEGKTSGFVKVVRETKYDELLGVHIIGSKATDLIAEACVALKVESTTEELFRTIHAHPTLSEAVSEAAHAAVGHAIHI